MDTFVQHIRAENIHGRLTFDIELNPTINIIHAENGAGKTTLLHILANALNGDFDRFDHLNFSSIVITLSNNEEIRIRKKSGPRDYEYKEVDIPGYYNNIPIPSSRTHEPSLAANYFPAFRTMIEAWADAEVRRERRPHPEEDSGFEDIVGRVREANWYHEIYTKAARRAFGSFVPLINYPSPMQITYALNKDVERALIEVGAQDRDLLSQVFVDVFKVLSETTPSKTLEESTKVLSEIDGLLSEDEKKWYFQGSKSLYSSNDVYAKLRAATNSIQINGNLHSIGGPILNVYRNSLRERATAQQEAFRQIEAYLKAINGFLSEKQIVFQLDGTSKRGSSSPSVHIQFSDGTLSKGLKVLSSGERQIVTLIYATTQMSEEKVILIDEPEISLHIDWQRLLLPKMLEQLDSTIQRQIIICTHSPSIGANYLDNMIDLNTIYKTSSS